MSCGFSCIYILLLMSDDSVGVLLMMHQVMIAADGFGDCINLLILYSAMLSKTIVAAALAAAALAHTVAAAASVTCLYILFHVYEYCSYLG